MHTSYMYVDKVYVFAVDNSHTIQPLNHRKTETATTGKQINSALHDEVKYSLFNFTASRSQDKLHV